MMPDHDSKDLVAIHVLRDIRALRHDHAEDCEPRRTIQERYCTCGAYAWNEAIDEAANVLVNHMWPNSMEKY